MSTPDTDPRCRIVDLADRVVAEFETGAPLPTKPKGETIVRYLSLAARLVAEGIEHDSPFRPGHYRLAVEFAARALADLARVDREDIPWVSPPLFIEFSVTHSREDDDDIRF